MSAVSVTRNLWRRISGLSGAVAKRNGHVESALCGVDTVQKASLTEPCILIDEDDKVLGSVSKEMAHLVLKHGLCLLHRAFTVILFNSKGELLLQQRAPTKITFPGYWTSPCCSHPLYVPKELEEADARGVREAAVRRLGIEWGIPSEQLNPDDLTYLTRLHYSGDQPNSVWGEHEITYLLHIKKDVDLYPNPNEMCDYRYVSRDNFDDFVKDVTSSGGRFTPWFNVLKDHFLSQCWTSPHILIDHDHIHRHLN